jgi:hypothetical protein
MLSSYRRVKLISPFVVPQSSRSTLELSFSSPSTTIENKSRFDVNSQQIQVEKARRLTARVALSHLHWISHYEAEVEATLDATHKISAGTDF